MNRFWPLFGFWTTLIAFAFLPTIVTLTLHVLLAWGCAFTVYALLEGLTHEHDR